MDTAICTMAMRTRKHASQARHARPKLQGLSGDCLYGLLMAGVCVCTRGSRLGTLTTPLAALGLSPLPSRLCTLHCVGVGCTRVYGLRRVNSYCADQPLLQKLPNCCPRQAAIDLHLCINYTCDVK